MDTEITMNKQFLENLLEAVLKITNAERGMAVSEDLTIQRVNNVEAAVLESAAFIEFANNCMRQAITEDKVIVTNNIITDPSQAPTTNTNFANLRVVVALPIKAHGALYTDQHIRNGVLTRKTTEKLKRLVAHLLENHYEDATTEDIIDIYNQLDD